MGLGPRLVIAGTHSGVGKTTVATGLMAAWRRRGLTVAPAKVGPDFIDPGYHEVATGRPGRNLDVFLCGAPSIPSLAARAAAGSDILVVEGVMGLFDGVGATPESSTAHVAQLLEAPVVLVVDASSMSGSVAALVRGYDEMLRQGHRSAGGFGGADLAGPAPAGATPAGAASAGPAPAGATPAGAASAGPAPAGAGLAGVILNRVGSDTHEAVLREALATAEPALPPVVGVLRRHAALTWRDRHLGLVPVVEDRPAVATSVRRLGEMTATALDLEALERTARSAAPLAAHPLPPARRVTPPGTTVPVAVASGPAFSFAYPENLERLAEAGADLLPFDPLEDPALPEHARALYAGGGFPEVFAEALAANTTLVAQVRHATRGGLVTWAECGGMLWLCRSIDGRSLCGALPADAAMGDRISVGYRTASVRRTSPIASAGGTLRGHELHYTSVTPAGDALHLAGRSGSRPEGWASPSLLATYLHLHLGARGGPAERFVETAAKGPPVG
jgi:cobyrinic acid a,c-diamide synthase